MGPPRWGLTTWLALSGLTFVGCIGSWLWLVDLGNRGPVLREAADQRSIAAVEELRHRGLALPVSHVRRSSLADSFHAARGDRTHLAIDIPAPRNTRVLAVEDGVIADLSEGGLGGRSLWLLGPEQRFRFYYAHLERWAPGLSVGKAVRHGELLGFVGTSGNAPERAPHLHFAIEARSDASSQWQRLNPYDVLR